MRKNLIKQRELNKLTKSQVALILGISPRQYSCIEAGTSNGSVEIWKKLRDLLGETIDFLLEQEVN